MALMRVLSVVLVHIPQLLEAHRCQTAPAVRQGPFSQAMVVLLYLFVSGAVQEPTRALGRTRASYVLLEHTHLSQDRSHAQAAQLVLSPRSPVPPTHRCAHRAMLAAFPQSVQHRVSSASLAHTLPPRLHSVLDAWLEAGAQQVRHHAQAAQQAHSRSPRMLRLSQPARRVWLERCQP